MTDKKTDTPKSTPTRTRPVEVVRWAYVLNEAGDVDAANVVVFGNNDDRTEFLRNNTDKWWRLADGPKGITLGQILKDGA